MELDKIKDEYHSFDGIQEYDNPLPRWWVYLFYITIVITPWHLAYFSAKGFVWRNLKPQETALAWSAGRLDVHKYREQERLKGVAAKQPEVDLAQRLSDPQAIAKGAEIYKSNCLACHGTDAGGVVGPNLVDNYYIHGGTSEELVKVVAEGVPQKGMIAWKPVLGMEKVYDVSAYVFSLKGSTPAQPKAPEGNIYP